MSFIGSAFAAVRVGREHKGAWDAAQRELEAGGSITSAVKAFAQATDGALDDRAAIALDEGIRLALDYAGQAARICGELGVWIEANGPLIGDAIRTTCDAIERHGPTVIEKARAVGERSDELAGQATDLAGRAGVLAIRAGLQVERLTARR